MTFFDRKRGLALSDPVDGKFRIIATEDGGRSWRVVATDMPAALPGEFAFAASGQCLVSAGGKDAWFATGGGAEARVFHSDDRGKTWEVTSTPIPSGPSAGIFALAFRNPRHGLAVGGDFAAPTSAPDAVALTDDAGATWRLAVDPPGEYRSGAHWVTGREVVAVGPTGSDASSTAGTPGCASTTAASTPSTARTAAPAGVKDPGPRRVSDPRPLTARPPGPGSVRLEAEHHLVYEHQLQSRPARPSGRSGGLAHAPLACLFGDESQHPIAPQVWHIRRCLHGEPSFRHSSHPAMGPAERRS